MRAYVTGGHGFVGGWLGAHLSEMGDEAVQAEHEVDVTDAEALAADIAAGAPDVVYHLAARSHVGRSWEDPVETLRVNVIGTQCVLDAAASCPRPPLVLIVSSAEVYGAGDGSPLDEETPLRPLSPYAASKAAAELVGLQAHLGRGLPLLRVRSFNHVGPGQSDAFVVSALASRIASAELSGDSEVKVGNLSAVRDYTDVRDVVRAYRLLAAGAVAGTLAAEAQVYNVCSGTGLRVEEVAMCLAGLAEHPIELVQDAELFRPADVPVLRGDGSAIASAIGWAPAIPLEETLADVLGWWREELRR